jgi:hypothetical protein
MATLDPDRVPGHTHLLMDHSISSTIIIID